MKPHWSHSQAGVAAVNGRVPTTVGPAKGSGIREVSPAMGASPPDPWVKAAEGVNLALPDLLKTPEKIHLSPGSVVLLVFFPLFLSSCETV